jgi:carboxyl-terminal processing protease
VVQVKNFDGKIDADDDTDSSIAYTGPLIVLTSKFSASASEILAGALQDYGRALIVGDSSTHGKGTVQSVNMLSSMITPHSDSATNDPGALKLTIKKFYRPSGVSTQLKGVVPDIVLPSVFNDSKDFGEASLDNPLTNDVIKAASFDRFNLVAPYVQELRDHSAQRLAGDKEYDYIREDIDHYKKLQADKTVTLNINQRTKEKEELEARQKARDKERKARKEPEEKIYEISLKQTELPGLPPPVQRTNSSLARLGAGAASTNSESASVSFQQAASAETPPVPGAEETEEDKSPVPDAALIEAEHILVDYIGILPKGDLLTAGNRSDNTEVNRKN